jgi:outer membrane protein assembly factor BamB
LKVLCQPRSRFFGAALLLILLLSACGSSISPDAGWAGISSDGKYIYGAYKDNVFRIDPAPVQGAPASERHFEWLAKAPSGANMYAPPAFGDDKVLYVGAYNKTMYAFPQDSGHPAALALRDNPASLAPDKFVGPATVDGDVVYIGMGNQGIRAYDRKTNAELWTFTGTDFGVWSAPLLEEGTLYFTSLDHHLYAIDPNGGKLKWKVDLGGAVAATPVYNKGFLYVGTFNYEFLAIDTAQQKIISRYKTEGWVWGRPVIQDNFLYFGDLAGWMYKLNADSFTAEWKKEYDHERPGGIRGRVALAMVKGKDLVIAGSENKYLRAFDAKTGDVIWTSARIAEDQILSDLIVMGNDVIFTTQSEKMLVAACNIETGAIDWQINLGDETTRLQTLTSVPIPTGSAVARTPPAVSTAAPTSNATPTPTPAT